MTRGNQVNVLCFALEDHYQRISSRQYQESLCSLPLSSFALHVPWTSGFHPDSFSGNSVSTPVIRLNCRDAEGTNVVCAGVFQAGQVVPLRDFIYTLSYLLCLEN